MQNHISKFEVLLASSSKRRHELLDKLKIKFKILKQDVDLRAKCENQKAAHFVINNFRIFNNNFFIFIDYISLPITWNT